MSPPSQPGEGEAEHGGVTGPAMRASRLLRVSAVWLIPLAVASVLVFLMALFYLGSVVNPIEHLSGLPLLLAN